MAGKNRIEKIKELIQVEKKVTVSELSARFEVTEETIRRDLEKLEQQDTLTRTFGGAVVNVQNAMEGIHFYKRASIQMNEKRKMGKIASELLKGKYTVAADASTSVMEAVKLIENSRDISLLTTSTAVFQELAGTDINIISSGGVFNRSTMSLQGTVAKDNIKKYHVDILLISCKGIDLEMGIMDSKEPEAEIKRLMMKQAREVVLFVDHTKFNKKAFVPLIGFEQIDYIITDKKPSMEWIELCEYNQINLLY